MADSRVYRFDGFTFDPATGELAGARETVRLPPKAARLLTLLLERPGELVSRETVRQELWPAQHVELDQVLAYTVRQVRAALGDEGGESRFVETLPRRGYRFVGSMETPAAPQPVAPRVAGPRTVAPPSGSLQSPAPHDVAPRRIWLRTALFAVAALLAVALFAAWTWYRASSVRSLAPAPVRVALLPLGEPGLEAANDPLTEALVVALTTHSQLAVLGPATTASLRATTRPHGELGRELGVDFVASGGYRPAERVLFLQLVRTSDGAHLFAHRYRGDADEVRAQLDEAAAGLAAAATGSLSPAGRPGGPSAAGSRAASSGSRSPPPRR